MSLPDLSLSATLLCLGQTMSVLCSFYRACWRQSRRTLECGAVPLGSSPLVLGMDKSILSWRWNGLLVVPQAWVSRSRMAACLENLTSTVADVSAVLQRHAGEADQAT